MNFSLVRHVTDEAGRKTFFINEWNQLLKTFFAKKNYGKDVESFIVGVTCVSRQFEQFFKVKKLKYTDNKTETHDGISIVIKKALEYSLKLNYNAVMGADDQQRMNLVAKEIMKSLDHLDSLPKKIKDFDKERFKADLESFFKERDLI